MSAPCGLLVCVLWGVSSPTAEHVPTLRGFTPWTLKGSNEGEVIALAAQKHLRERGGLGEGEPVCTVIVCDPTDKADHLKPDAVRFTTFRASRIFPADTIAAR